MDAQLHLLPLDSTATDAPEARSDDRSTARSGERSGDRSPVGARPGWRLDDGARTVGLAGIARAREALQAARRVHHDEASAA